MATAKGFAAKAAVGKEASWGTPVNVSQLIPFTSESLTKEFSRLEDGILGDVGRRLAEISQIGVNGGIEADLTYTGFDILFEAALGSVSGTGTSTDPYIFDLTEDVNESITIAINKQVTVHEYAGCKINNLRIQGSTGDKLTVSIDFLGKSHNRGTNATNTDATINGASGFGKRILFSDCSLNVAGSVLGFSSFNFQLNNNLTAIYENSLEAIEISRNGKREVSLSIEFSRYKDDTFHDYFDLDAEVPIILSATDGTNYFELNIPRARVSKIGDPIGGADIVKQSIEFIILKGTSSEFAIKRY